MNINEQTCQGCGAPINLKSNYCEYCGQPHKIYHKALEIPLPNGENFSIYLHTTLQEEKGNKDIITWDEYRNSNKYYTKGISEVTITDMDGNLIFKTDKLVQET